MCPRFCILILVCLIKKQLKPINVKKEIANAIIKPRKEAVSFCSRTDF